MTKSRNLAKFPKTSAIQVPSGDTAARPSGANGYFRYNTTTSSFEGYSDGNWGAVGGAMYVSANTVSDANNISTGYFGLPAGTTGQRPANTANGYLRYNTTLSSFEGFSSGAWGSIGGSLSSSGLASWNVVSSNYTVGNNIQLLANSAAGSFTITLPASPVLANVVVIADGSGPNTGWSNNNVLVDPNGKTIQGIADNLALNISRSSVSLIYDGATWQVISTTGPKGVDGAAGANGTIGAAGVGANATQTNYRFNATNNQTIFVGTDAYSQTLSYNVNAIGVYLNGVFLRPTEDYVANNGTTIYLISPTLANDALDVVSFQSMSLTATQNTITTYVYTASNNQTSFGGADINGSVLNYNTDNLFVTLNGLTLRNAVDYNQSNSSYLALTSGASANDELSIVAFGAFQIPSSANTVVSYYYTANAGQTTITGTDSYGRNLSYSVNNLIVTRNGSTLRNGPDYAATNGTTVVLNNPTFANDEIGILTFTSFNAAANGYTQAESNARYLSKIADDTLTANVNNTSNGYFQVPIGTTAQRPAATTQGYIRYNTSLNSLESANGTAWSNVGSGAASSSSSANGYSANTTATDFLSLPQGTLAQRPVNVANGMIRWNTSNNWAEMYTGSNTGWVVIAYGGQYTVTYLVAAGGGGGGSRHGGGGGAGGVVTGTQLVVPGTTYSIAVGAGGNGSPANGGSAGFNGSNSTALGQTCIGGGAGGAYGDAGNPSPQAMAPATSGGSGGGAGTGLSSNGAGTAGQGYAGGTSNSANGNSAGGGGAGAVGTSVGGAGGPGGIGILFAADGYGYYYGGGGGGGGWAAAAGNGGTGGGGGGASGTTSGSAGTGGAGRTPGAAGTYVNSSGTTAGGNGGTNTGGGGGGGGQQQTSVYVTNGGSGGSGIVIISYTGAQRGSGGTVTSNNGQTIHTFTSSATFTA